MITLRVDTLEPEILCLYTLSRLQVKPQIGLGGILLHYTLLIGPQGLI